MMRLHAAVLMTALLPAAAFPSDVVQPAGRKLADALTAMQVEKGWKAGEAVDWETGKPARPVDKATAALPDHSGAFVAAASGRLGVPMVRPSKAGEAAATAPKGLIHAEAGLADAQAAWLAKDGTKHGWTAVATAAAAQAAANEGQLVVAVAAGAGGKDGHVAVVHPWARTAAGIAAEGPEVMQAGAQNFDHNTLKAGFKHLPGAWPTGVKFYAHPLAK